MPISQKLGLNGEISNWSFRNLYKNKSHALITAEDFITAIETYLVPLGYDVDIFPNTFGVFYRSFIYFRSISTDFDC